ncbi:hypothetical protein [Pelomonas sp. SE-A7]|uniref:hypothetical protein n=1 Tax=Pelomonas sp. SE-A7 TaxID=3054953 RepID=UPI00259D0AD4|nr:hypothetical protein [Pelomonas sp. SE-A7]MDM4765269.1 hypothetical protein [Pelomonas sp. SE-A7]
MAIPTLEFFSSDWLQVAEGIQVVELRIVANPPVAAGVGIVVFARKTPPASNPQAPFGKVGNPAVIDNLPNTPAGAAFQLAVQRGCDYVIRFQGEAHLLMPGFQSVTCGFIFSHAQAVLENFGGAKTAANARAAALNGQTFFRTL